MSVFPNGSTDSVQSLLKFQLLFVCVCGKGQVDPKIDMEIKGSKSSHKKKKKNLEKEKAARFTFPCFKTYYKATAINTVVLT